MITIKNQQYCLFRARTNTLKLQDWKGHINKSTICRLCNKETENLQHFILHCTALEKTRRNITNLKKKQKETDEDLIADFLLFRTNNENKTE